MSAFLVKKIGQPEKQTYSNWYGANIAIDPMTAQDTTRYANERNYKFKEVFPSPSLDWTKVDLHSIILAQQDEIEALQKIIADQEEEFSSMKAEASIMKEEIAANRQKLEEFEKENMKLRRQFEKETQKKV